MKIRLGKKCLQVQQGCEAFLVLVSPIPAANKQIQWAVQSRPLNQAFLMSGCFYILNSLAAAIGLSPPVTTSLKETLERQVSGKADSQLKWRLRVRSCRYGSMKKYNYFLTFS